MATNPSRNALEIPISPRLPSSPTEAEVWSRRFTDEYSRILGLYFRQLDAANSALLGRQGGKYLNTPYGAFSNTATQAITAANTPYVLVLNSSDMVNGMTLASNRLTVAQPGIYNVQFSLQFENTSTQISDAWIWLRKNGVDVPGTASTLDIDSTHGGVNGYALAAANFFLSMAANDYIELVIAGSATGLSVEAYTSSVSPFTRPSIPSSVVTVSFVSTQPT